MSRGRLLLVSAITLLLAAYFWFDLGRFISIAALQEHRQLLQGYYARHAAAVIAAFMVIYIAQTALALPGAAVLSLAAGALFGTVVGTLTAVLAATVGAILSFLVTRYFVGEFIERRFGAKLAGIDRELRDRGISYLLFLRLVPLFPFFLVNLAAGLTKIPLRIFAAGTLIGIIPGAFVFVNAGASLAKVDSVSSVASPRILLSFALLGLFALVPAIYGRISGRR